MVTLVEGIAFTGLLSILVLVWKLNNRYAYKQEGVKKSYGV